jgi:cytochrome P450
MAVRDFEEGFGPGASSGSRCVLGETLAAVRRSDNVAEAAIDEETVVGNVLQMQESGTGDLSSLLVWVVKHLADNPVWTERLREVSASVTDGSDAASGPRSLGERVIRESLRLEQSEFLNRRTTQDIRFHGYVLPKGWRIRICVREAHRSPEVFERPTEFDPDRFLGNHHPPAEYSPFGLYRHHCLAGRLVQRIGAVFVEELAREHRLTVVQDGPRVHGRFHWQPSPRLRVSLEPRDASRRSGEVDRHDPGRVDGQPELGQ